MTKPRAAALSLLLAIVPATTAAPSFAQTLAEDPTTAMARARFKEGVDFYDRGEYEQARASFLQAYALKKHPAVLLNLAWSCLKANRVAEADRYFRQFLAEDEDISDKQRSDANEGLGQTRAKLGHVTILASPGAEISVDGVPAGTAPLADAIDLEAGSHSLGARVAGSDPETQTLTVGAGDKLTVRFKTEVPAPAAEGASIEGGPSEAPKAALAPSATQPQAADQPSPRPLSSSGRSGFFPINMIPVYIGGALTIAGAGVAIAMLEAKQNAQSNADQTRANLGSRQKTCPATSGDARVADACATYASDNADVNTDATIGNIAIAVSAAALVGTLAYWVVAPKTREEPSAGRTAPVKVTPWVGRSLEGLSVSVRF